MLNNKYGKVLTIILIVAIIVIIGLLIFVGIDWYKAYNTKTSQNEGMEQFNSYINSIANEQNIATKDENIANNELNTINNEQTPIITEIDENVENQNSQTNNGGHSSSSQKPTYKGFTMIGSIRIPKTGLSSVILAESSPKAMEVAICRMYGPAINEVGNVVLIGHNFKNGTLFSDNKKLAKGDKIYLKGLDGKEVEYTITKKYTTTVEDFEYAVRDTNGKREISLSTCTDDTKSRLIFWAEES